MKSQRVYKKVVCELIAKEEKKCFRNLQTAIQGLLKNCLRKFEIYGIRGSFFCRGA
jgi:hypothetical protein